MLEKSTSMKDGTLTVKDDSRILPFGKILRKTKINELPQLINVLKGEMSIVGPRPALHTQVDRIAARRAVGIDRLLPGITGWAQINGRDEIELSEKLELDYEYFQRHNIWLDIRIVYRTVPAVLCSNGVAH